MCGVALITLDAKHTCHIVLSSLACLTLPCFCTLSQKWHDIWGGGVVGHKMCVLTFCTPLSETFFTLRRTERDVIINARMSSCIVPVILSDFNQTGIFLTFFKNTQVSTFLKICPV